MTSLSSIGKARNTLQRWLLGEDGSLPKPDREPVAENETSSEVEGGQNLRISRFMEELGESSQEWLGRVRMISFETIRDRVGSSWPKLQGRVEILAEKIIQNEIGGCDRYLNAGNAEFLVFFADATPEESRIRCFAIVETIHEKLFGRTQSADDVSRRMAECHMVHHDDLAIAWEEAHSRESCEAGDRSQSPRACMATDAEMMDGADITDGAQRVIDAIISSGTQCQNMDELTPLLIRLKSLTRSLKALEPALVAARKSGQGRSGPGAFLAGQEGETAQIADANAQPLDSAYEDISELIGVLDVGANHSHADLLAALENLRRARLERAARQFAEEDQAGAAFPVKKADAAPFCFTPVYRSVSCGEHIHQGIYRVQCGQEKGPKAAADNALAGDGRQELMALERATLEHAIEFLLDRKSSARFVLMARVHVETLRSPHSQMRYSTILRSAQLRAKRRLVIEVAGYSHADDTIAIRRAIEELRVHSNALFIGVSPDSLTELEKIAIACKKCGVHACGLDVSAFGGQQAARLDAITRLSSLGQQYGIHTFVDGIGEVSDLNNAIVRGATYLCAPPLRPPLDMPGDAQRASLQDLYVAI